MLQTAASGWLTGGELAGRSAAAAGRLAAAGVRPRDGYLRLVRRATELIITGGLNVYPREVEDVLRGHPAVRDVAVVGLPDQEWGEVVTAYCVGDRVPESDLSAYCAARLAAFKHPRR